MIEGCVGGAAGLGALLWLVGARPDGPARYAAAVLLALGVLMTVIALWGRGFAERIITVLAGLAGIVALLVAIPTKSDVPPEASDPWCPGARRGDYQITGTTSSLGATVRTGPRLDAPTANTGRRHFPANCRAGFVGYCIGDRVFDHFIGTPDQKWYILPNHTGVVASAVILEHGAPTLGMAPRSCPGALPAPATVALTSAKSNARNQLTATMQAPNGVLVGLLSRPPGGRWQRVGWDQRMDDGFTVTGTPPAEWHGRGELLAVTCYAADRPSPVMARYSARTSGGRVALSSLPLSAPGMDRRQAGRAACRQ